MKRLFILAVTIGLFASCKDDKNSETETAGTLAFKTENFEKKTSLPCKTETCTNVKISVPTASDVDVVADSINKKIFNTVRGIVYFGEKPTNSANYQEIMDKFIGSYEELKKKFPDENASWEAKIDAKVTYQSENIINVSVDNYMFTGGAHGYQGIRSLLFDAKTGKEIKRADFINDEAAFKAFAEKKFRAKFQVAEGKPINSTGLMFEGEKFALPQNIFFTDKGLMLYYNTYEIASYADGARELLLPYGEIENFLKLK